MQRWITIIGLCALLIAGPGQALAQGDEAPPCTAADVAPVGAIVSGMVAALTRDGNFEVDALLDWRGQIAALDVPPCAGMVDALLQLQLASDELLIGALLLERAASPTLAADGAARDELATIAATALNTGLTNLVGMRFTMAEAAGDSDVALPFGELDAAAVIAAFEAAGLPLAEVNLNAGPAGSSTPATEIARATFDLPTVFDGGVGQVLVFADARGRDAWLAYLFGEVADPGYVYIHQNVIVQLTAELDRVTALQFQGVLRAVE